MGVEATDLKQRIYCHRGFWASKDEQNSPLAISRASAVGFGIETDIRDYQSSIVVSHDPVHGQQLLIEEFKFITPVALNLKSDGLLSLENQHLLEILSCNGSFVFDGSVPEMLKYRRAGLPHALRVSEYEKEIAWKSQYLWLDAFESDWWISGETLKRLSNDYFVIVVSPELHQRQHINVWDVVLEEIMGGNQNIGLCTDYPEQFFELTL